KLKHGNCNPINVAICCAKTQEDKIFFVEILIKYGANVNKECDNYIIVGRFPIHAAIRSNNYPLVYLLIENKAEINLWTHTGNRNSTANHLIASGCDLTMWILLTLNGLKLSEADFNNNIPITRELFNSLSPVVISNNMNAIALSKAIIRFVTEI